MNFVEADEISAEEYVANAEKVAGRQLTSDEREQLLEAMAQETIYLSDKYQVHVRDAKVGGGWPDMVHLSIKRRDKEVIHDWRDLQAIKNALVGAENEGVELYPSESRLTDPANQYHLWVVKDPELKFPFGFTTRFVVNESLGDAKQRPYGEAKA